MYFTFVLCSWCLVLLANLGGITSIRVRASEKRSRFYHIGQLAHQRNSGKTAWESEEARKSKALALCETSGLDKHQRKLCAKFPLEILAAFQGYRDAVNECQYQFRYERWNCSSLVNVGTNVQPLSIPMMRRGFKEVAFVHALVATAVAKSVSLDCARGLIKSCDRVGSKRRRSKENVHIKNFAATVHHGLFISEKFLNSKTDSHDFQGIANKHNLKAGRVTMIKSLKSLCKCHGVSGSCTSKSCVKIPSSLREIGTALKKMYYDAKKVEPANDKRTGLRLQAAEGESHPTKHDLIYMENSPNFCDADNSLGTRGISGRICSKNATEENSCASLCCGRGYNTQRLKKDTQCQCKFKWCCYVDCKKCTSETWVTSCK